MSDSDDGSNMSDDSFQGSEVCSALFGLVTLVDISKDKRRNALSQQLSCFTEKRFYSGVHTVRKLLLKFCTSFSPSVSTSLFSQSWNSAHRGLLKKSKK